MPEPPRPRKLPEYGPFQHFAFRPTMRKFEARISHEMLPVLRRRDGRVYREQRGPLTKEEISWSMAESGLAAIELLKLPPAVERKVKRGVVFYSLLEFIQRRGQWGEHLSRNASLGFIRACVWTEAGLLGDPRVEMSEAARVTLRTELAESKDLLRQLQKDPQLALVVNEGHVHDVMGWLDGYLGLTLGKKAHVFYKRAKRRFAVLADRMVPDL